MTNSNIASGALAGHSMALHPRILARSFPLDSGWRTFAMCLYGLLCLASVFAGKFWFAAAYLLIVLFLSTKSIFFDAFSPEMLTIHAFGLYFLAVMALNDELTTSTLMYVIATLLLYIVVSLAMPPLHFRSIRTWATGQRVRLRILPKIVGMQAVGFVVFLTMVRLAGFSSPLEIFNAPLKYRFFMLSGGMTYVKLIMDFTIMMPVLVAAVAYYKESRHSLAFRVSFSAALFYALCTGERSAVVNLIVQVLIIRHVFGKRLSIRLLATCAAILIPFVALMGEYRMIRYAQEGGSVDAMKTAGATNVLVLAAERLDASIRLDELMTSYKGEPLRLGLSYVSLPIQVIPRAVWKGKPRIPNPEMTRLIGRDDPNLDIAFDFGIFGETLINFWWAGIVAGALLTLACVHPLQYLYEHAALTKEPFAVLACALFWMAPVSVVVSGLVQASIFLLFDFVALWILKRAFFDSPARRTKRKLFVYPEHGPHQCEV